MSSSYSFEIGFLENILKQDPKDLQVMELLAGLYTKEGKIDEGLALDERIVASDPQNPTALYNLACSLTLKNNKTKALTVLREAFELGYSDFDWTLKDPDLKLLHPNPDFSALIAEFKVRGKIND